MRSILSNTKMKAATKKLIKDLRNPKKKRTWSVGYINRKAHLMNADQMQLIANEFGNSSIESFAMSYYYFEDSGTKILAKGIANSKSLITLDLSSCHLTTLGAKIIANALTKCSTFEALYLYNNGFYFYPDCDNNWKFFWRLSRCKNLHLLNLWGNFFHHNKESTEYLINFLKKHENLLWLDLSITNLNSNHALTIINRLEDNLIEKCGVRKLETLHLSCNKIDDTIGKTLFRFLKKYRSLKNLDISYNEIGDKTANQIANLLMQPKYSGGLRKIDLSCTNITINGIEMLAKAIQQNDQIIEMRLDDLRIKPDSKDMELTNRYKKALKIICDQCDENQKKIKEKSQILEEPKWKKYHHYEPKVLIYESWPKVILPLIKIGEKIKERDRFVYYNALTHRSKIYENIENNLTNIEYEHV